MTARRAARRGSTLPMTAVCVVGLFAFTALAVDLGMVMVARTECQNASDAAALAGARQLNTVNATTNNQPAALIAAGDTAAQNPYLNTQFQDLGGSTATATAWGATSGRSLASGQGTGAVGARIATGAKVSNMQVGLYTYDSAAQKFSPDFVGARAVNQAWTAVRVDTVGVQPAFFSRVFGMAGLQTQARAVAIHRPRDIALVLDMSSSMRFGTVWNWASYTADAGTGGGSISPDPLYPQFGHYARYNGYNSTSPAVANGNWTTVTTASRPHPFYQTASAPMPNGSTEVISPNNYSVETGGGPAAVKDFLTGTPAAGANPTSSMARAFHNWDPPGFAPVFGGPASPVVPTGDFSGWNTANAMPAPPDLTTQADAWGANRSGDRWPRKKGVMSTTAPWDVDNASGAAVTAAEFLGWTQASFASGNNNWPTSTGSDGLNGYARNAVSGTNSATASTSLPNTLTGASAATFNSAKTKSGGGLITYSTSTTTATVPPTALAREWDNFRDGTWERNGYDLDVEHYVAGRGTDWDPRWEWDLGADRTRPATFGGTGAWGSNLPLGVAPFNPVDFPRTENPNHTFRPRLKPVAERFKGYTLSPGYYGKTFFVWPPDPRTPVGEPGDANYQAGDWRQRFFVWTPPLKNPYAPSPPTGYSTTGSTFTPGTTTQQYREGTWTYTYTLNTPPSTSGSTSGSSTSGSSTSGSSTSGTTGTPPPPPPPPTRHDRTKKRLTAAEVVRLRNQADGTAFVNAMVMQTGLVANEYLNPSRFGNLNLSLFMNTGNGYDQDTTKPMPLSNPFSDNNKWSFQFNYRAFFKWLKSGPQTLPPSLRGGRLVYYKTIPNDIDGSGSADDQADQLFWREYIEFVLGHWEYRYDQRWLAGYETVGWPELGGVQVPARVNMSKISLGGDGRANNDIDRLDDGTNAGYDNNPLYGKRKWKEWENLIATNTVASQAQITADTLAGRGPPQPRDLRPYMGYMDNPARPRQHLWFGPLSMMAYLANVQQGNQNMWPGTATEAQSWQLKAAVDSALDDVQKNHPNDAVGLAYFSSKLDTNWNVSSGYRTIAAPLGQDFTRIKNSLYYPLSLVNSGAVNTPTTEMRPYTTGSMLNYTGKTIVPNAQDGTDPNTGLALAYNILTPSTANAAIGRATNGTQSGRKGAAKIVIFETDGAPTSALNLTMNTNGQNSYYTVQNTGQQTSTYFQTARDAAIQVTQQIVKPVNSTAGTDSGFSTPNTPARVYAIGFGDLFNFAGTPNATQSQAMDFLRDVMIAGNTLPASAGGTPGYLALPADHIVGDPRYIDRMAKLRTAFERILQSGVQVTLIE